MGAKDLRTLLSEAGAGPGDALHSVLASADVKALAAVLDGEHPQTVATVLAHLAPARGAALLKLITEPNRSDLVMRVARLSPVDPASLDELATALAHRLAGREAQRTDLGGAAKVAALIGALGRETSDALLGSLTDADAELAARVRTEMFRFSDLTKLDARGMQALLKNVPNATLRLALKAAPASVAELIYANVSARAAETLREDIAAMPKSRRSDVDAAQADVVRIAMAMIDRGELIVADPNERYV